MTYLKIKGQEASSWLKMVTRKMKLEVLPDTVHKLSPPQARKNCFIWMGHLYGAFGPGTTCWPGGGLKCSPGVGGSKMASRGVDWLLAPPHAHLWYGYTNHTSSLPVECGSTEGNHLKLLFCTNFYFVFTFA